MLAAVGEKGIVEVFDLASGQPLFQLELPVEGLRAVTWKADSKRIAASGWSTTVYIICTDQTTPAECPFGEVVSSFVAHNHSTLDLDWSLVDNKIATVSQQDQMLKLWDGETLELLNSIALGDPFQVAFSPSGDKIAVVDFMGSAYVLHSSLDLTTLRTVGPTDRPAYSIAWGATDATLAIGTGSPLATANLGNVYVWDDDQQRIIETYRLQNKVIYDVAWSPDDGKLAALSDDNVIHVWDRSTATTLITFGLQAGQTSSELTWDASGDHVIFGGGESTLPFRLPAFEDDPDK